MGQQFQTIKPDNDIDRLLLEFTNILRKGYVEIGDDKTIMPSAYISIAKDIENFDVRDSDIFVISHMKSGKFYNFPF